MLSLHGDGCSSSTETAMITKMIPSDWTEGAKAVVYCPDYSAHLCRSAFPD